MHTVDAAEEQSSPSYCTQFRKVAHRQNTDFETLTDRSTAAEDHKSLNAKPSAAGRFWRFTEKIPILTQFN